MATVVFIIHYIVQGLAGRNGDDGNAGPIVSI